MLEKQGPHYCPLAKLPSQPCRLQTSRLGTSGAQLFSAEASALSLPKAWLSTVLKLVELAWSPAVVVPLARFARVASERERVVSVLPTMSLRAPWLPWLRGAVQYGLSAPRPFWTGLIWRDCLS